MPTTIQDALTNLASSLQIAPAGPLPTEVGQPVNVELAPPADGLHVTDTLTAPVSLTWLTKNVNFTDSKLLLSPLGLDPNQTSSIESNIANISLPAAGLLGQLEGHLPIPVEVPVAVTVAWSVRDAQGNNLQSNNDYAALNGSASPEATFLFGLVSDQAFVPVVIHADVTLTLTAQNLSAQAHLDLPLLVPALNLPTVIALFQRPNFNKEGKNRYVLVAVPEVVPATTMKELLDLLRTVRTVVSRVTSIPKYVLLLQGLDRAIAALTDPGQKIEFRQADAIPKFRDIVYKRDRVTKRIIDTAQDLMSSLIFIAPPVRWVQLFNSPQYSTGEGELVVGPTAAMLVLIGDLSQPHSTIPPVPLPVSIPVQSPYPEQFNNRLSSLRFMLQVTGPVVVGQNKGAYMDGSGG